MWKSSDLSSLLWIHGKRKCLVLVFFPETDDFYLFSWGRKERYLVR